MKNAYLQEAMNKITSSSVVILPNFSVQQLSVWTLSTLVLFSDLIFAGVLSCMCGMGCSRDFTFLTRHDCQARVIGMLYMIIGVI